MFNLGSHIIESIGLFIQALMGGVYLALIIFVAVVTFVFFLRLVKERGEEFKENQE